MLTPFRAQLTLGLPPAFAEGARPLRFVVPSRPREAPANVGGSCGVHRPGLVTEHAPGEVRLYAGARVAAVMARFGLRAWPSGEHP